MIKIKQNYHDETKTILKIIDEKSRVTSNFYINLAKDGVYIETHMISDSLDRTYENIKLEITSQLCLDEILDAIYNSQGVGAYFCKENVECFTFEYYE